MCLCVDHLRTILDRDHLQAHALAAGFVRRSGKLSADDFLIMLLYCSSLDECGSLSYMCSILEDHFSVVMRKQSLDKRFSSTCLHFVKSVLSELLEEQIQTSPLYQGEFWKSFRQVRIKDSTKFKAPDQMREDFKGNGGSPAGICIQYEYDLSTGKILDLQVGSGGGNDRTDAINTCKQPRQGELVIRDLGYYSLDVFTQFSLNEVTFLSRLYSKTCVYYLKSEQWHEVDFSKIYHKMRKYDIQQQEIEVFLGVEHKLPVRMVLSLVDDPVYQNRIREREKENRKRGQKMTQEVRIRYHFNIYITNATNEQLPAKQIFSAYRLRWQVELVFKSWKSLYKVHLSRKMNQNRYLCMLYAKLILVVINLQITRCLQVEDRKSVV